MKLKLYVWKGVTVWYADIAPVGRKQIDGGPDGQIITVVHAPTQPEALARGLAALDELSVSQ